MYGLQFEMFFSTYLFQNNLMTTPHFILRYLICVFSIFIGSSIILFVIHTGIITSTYNLKFENQCSIFIRKHLYFSTIHFRFNESYIHFYLLLWIYFDLIGYIEFQFLLYFI